MLQTPWTIEWVFLVVLVVRLVNALTLKTFFQPDEFYQSLEPAHKLIFGYGYITWEWHENLRSSLHPLIYAMGYKLALMVSNDRQVMVMVPKVINAIIASIGETCIFIFATKYSNNPTIGKISLLLSLVNPFNWYVITRSFSNNLEMVLTAAGLAYWPWRAKGINKSLLISCGLAYISCLMRPTTSIIWIILGLYYILNLTWITSVKLVIILLGELVVIVMGETWLNYKFYGHFTVPLYNFIEFNVIKNLSIFYGSSPWHFHIFQSIPIILMTYVPFFLHGIYKFHHYCLILGIIVFGTVAVFSMVDHKEFRFIYPLMPILLLISAQSVNYLLNRNRYTWKWIMTVIIVVNIIISLFFSRVNERGVIDIIEYLGNRDEDFGLLTPCHSTPWQSHLHDEKFETQGWFITCEPPLHLHNANRDTIKHYRDESDQLFDDPQLFMATNFPASIDDTKGQFKYGWPSQLIIFESFDTMVPILHDKGYKECKRFFNSYFHWDDRRHGDLVVYCKLA